jgi:hypothetical protein
MNIKLFSAALGLALTAGIMTAHAQKTINVGYETFSVEMQGQPAEETEYFKPDSTAQVITFGAGTVKILTTAKYDYVAVLLDIPVAGLKKAGIATPAEIEEVKATLPTYTFTPATDTKVISGFNCKKVIAKDTKTGKSYDVWITNDVVVPSTAMPSYFQGIGGMPIQFTATQQGQEQTITIKTIVDGPAPKGTYAVASDFEKGTMADLRQQ